MNYLSMSRRKEERQVEWRFEKGTLITMIVTDAETILKKDIQINGPDYFVVVKKTVRKTWLL